MNHDRPGVECGASAVEPGACGGQEGGYPDIVDFALVPMFHSFHLTRGQDLGAEKGQDLIP